VGKSSRSSPRDEKKGEETKRKAILNRRRLLGKTPKKKRDINAKNLASPFLTKKKKGSIFVD